VKLKRIDEFNRARRRRVAARYAEAWSGLTVEIPHEDGIGSMCTTSTPCSPITATRSWQALQEADIGHAIYYPIPLHRQAAFDNREKPPPSLPVTESVAARCLSLPVFPELEDARSTSSASTIRARPRLSRT
jgi:dTDP-4-amino-4,6-dideoxygalactose transaminase